MMAPSPGQHCEQHKAPLRMPKGWSRDRDPQPALLPAAGTRQLGELVLHPCTSMEKRVKSPGMPWQRVRLGLAEHLQVPRAWQGLGEGGQGPRMALASPSGAPALVRVAAGWAMGALGASHRVGVGDAGRG